MKTNLRDLKENSKNYEKVRVAMIGGILMEIYSKNKQAKRILAGILTIIMVFVSIDLSQFVSVKAATEYDTLYLIDNTAEKWVKNDNATIKAIDNSNGHTAYWMTQKDETTWSVKVPKSAYNITFNRYAEDKTTQWNSWSAGGRDKNNAYYVDRTEYGHWSIREGSEEYFHAGDIIYLDVSEFTQWENDDAVMYVNFTNATKIENNGENISIADADKKLYNPREVKSTIGEHIYGYAVTKVDEGATELRFWRGNNKDLWNYSISLSYIDFLNGLNCVKVTGWDGEGSIASYSYDNADSDNDGLPDFYEEMAKLDKNNPDSDGDGLPDGYEIFSNYSYPNKADTDGDGISDADEDTDNDGLSNLEEYKLGINPIDKDTDGDGLNDAVEIKYNMDPNNQDTLNDGIMDGDRIFDLDVKCNKSDNGKLSPSIDIQLQGEQLESFSTTKLDNNDPFLNNQIPGYLGNGYEFYVDGKFEKAQLSFKLDESITNDNSCEPVIYYWNEETQLLEEVEGQYAEGDCLKVELKHFSKYIVLNKNEYNRMSFRFTIKAPTSDENLKKSFDVAMVLDESGSISSSNFSEMKAQCSDLVSGLNDTDRIAVFTFDESVRTISTFESPSEAVKTIGSLYQHDGNTAIYDAIKTATNGFAANSSSEKSKIIILLTDGYDNSSSTIFNSVIAQAKASDVIIYAVGVGYVNKTALTDLSESTGGSFYYLSNFSQLKAVFNTIIEEADLYKDSDGDGLSDYHEKKIAAGELLTGSGEALNLCSKMNYLSPDSDGDGLLDGEEVVIKKLPFSENYYCYMYSNPCMADTDLDTYDDYVEEYIGTSPINIHNSLNTSNIMNSSLPSGFSFNNWWDWKELIEEHAWNYIHNAVQSDIVKKYQEIEKEQQIISSLRCDLLRRRSSEIWEVKPTSYAKEPKRQRGLDQLAKYVAAYLGGKIGGAYISNSSFTFGDYTIDYYNMQNGLIIYKFKKQKKEPEPVTVPEPETEKEDGYRYISKTSPSNGYAFWGTLAGIAIVGGTLAEDFFSGGIGIADDAASFAIAYKLIFG